MSNNDFNEYLDEGMEDADVENSLNDFEPVTEESYKNIATTSRVVIELSKKIFLGSVMTNSNKQAFIDVFLVFSEELICWLKEQRQQTESMKRQISKKNKMLYKHILSETNIDGMVN